MTRHGAAVLRVARCHSRSAADAEDAFQRAFEVLLTKPPRLAPGEDPLPWLLTVVRNEALMIVRRQRRAAGVAFEDLAEAWADDVDSPIDRVVDIEASNLGREALLRLNPDQARCLLLRADGLSYEEIAGETGFTYAKVHRSLSEGRRVYRGLLGRIESGAECRRLEPVLSRYVDAELDAATRRDIELHIGNCAHCRATVRDFVAAPRELAALFPIATAVSSDRGGIVGQAVDQLNAAAAWINERLFAQFSGGPATEMVAAKKFAIAAAVTTSLVAGGATIERVTSDDRPVVPPVVQPLPDAPAAPVSGVTGQSTPDGATAESNPVKPKRPRNATETDIIEAEASRPRPQRSAERKPQLKRPAAESDQTPIIELPEDVDPNSIAQPGIEP